MVIIDLQPQDLDSFYDCFSALMLEGYGQFPENLSKFFLEHDYTKVNFALWVERNFRKFLIIKDDSGKVIGFLVGDHTYGGVGFISWFGLLPEWRGKGLGSKLLSIYETYIIGKGAHLLELYTHNKAKDFYTKHGFVEIGRREIGLFGQLNIIMDKKLGEWSFNA